MVPGQLDSLETIVSSPEGVMQRSMADLTARGLPRTLSIVYQDNGALGPFDVSVSGRLGGSVVVSRQAAFTFVEGERRVLVMHLAAACRTTSCSGAETCTENGCRSVDVPESELLEWTGEPPTLSGGGTPDAGPPDGGCTPSAETCNDADDDCDGMVDEDFDLMTDTQNCGSCGNACGGRNNMCCGGSCERMCP